MPRAAPRWKQEFANSRQLRQGGSAARPQAILALARRRGCGVTLRIAGVDEAGRGPLAGPVVAAAVILRAAALGFPA
jgi:ribonuclease HII